MRKTSEGGAELSDGICEELGADHHSRESTSAATGTGCTSG
ncbi:hypothetical protein [Kineococcus arenarius]